MTGRRVPKLNALLQEVISEVLTKDLHHLSGIPNFVSITHVEITSDLSYAKVFISVIGDEKQKRMACAVLQEHAGQIAHIASRKVVMRYFPKLDFLIDEGLEKQLRIQEILQKVAPKEGYYPDDDVDSENSKNSDSQNSDSL